MSSEKIPVTVLTGFLGSGKTTLLNRILTENHGKRIAVIENEFGEIGIDQALVIDADEEIFEMNNGCICCTVRGDLIRILGNLMRRRDKFDHILVETTGMADPGPVAQTFFVDDEMREMFKLDGIITMIDAKHVALHIDDSNECKEQIAFGDVIVLNKTDLVPEADVAKLETRIRSMNALARMERAVNADVSVAAILDVGGFDLDRALEKKPTFLEPEYPFEWAGTFSLDEGRYRFSLADGPDPAMSVAVLPLAVEPGRELAKSQLEDAMRVFAAEPRGLAPDDTLTPGAVCWKLDLAARGEKTFSLLVCRSGTYGLFTQHLPEEFELALIGAKGTCEATASMTFAAGHTHDETVTSVGIRLDGAFDEKKLNAWLGTLLRERGKDIFRMKGILNVHGKDTRYVFQGVHMLVDGREDRPWGDRPRVSEIVFIGRKLDRDMLNRGVRACLV